MKLIVGLGNPGKTYQKTRHNIGFITLDALHEKLHEYGVSNWELSKKFNAQVSGCAIHNEKIILAKPMTFMNHSGQSVQLIAHFYKMKASDIIVLHDDKDLKLGDLKIQTDRGDAGHNGVKSIIDHIGGKNFTRVRIGVASANERKMSDTAKFVLSKFGFMEKHQVDEMVERVTEEIIKII